MAKTASYPKQEAVTREILMNPHKENYVLR